MYNFVSKTLLYSNYKGFILNDFDGCTKLEKNKVCPVFFLRNERLESMVIRMP